MGIVQKKMGWKDKAKAMARPSRASSACREHMISIAARKVAVTMGSRNLKWHTMFMNPFACVGGGHTPAM